MRNQRIYVRALARNGFFQSKWIGGGARGDLDERASASARCLRLRRCRRLSWYLAFAEAPSPPPPVIVESRTLRDYIPRNLAETRRNLSSDYPRIAEPEVGVENGNSSQDRPKKRGQLLRARIIICAIPCN